MLEDLSFQKASPADGSQQRAENPPLISKPGDRGDRCGSQLSMRERSVGDFPLRAGRGRVCQQVPPYKMPESATSFSLVLQPPGRNVGGPGGGQRGTG